MIYGISMNAAGCRLMRSLLKSPMFKQQAKIIHRKATSMHMLKISRFTIASKSFLLTLTVVLSVGFSMNVSAFVRGLSGPPTNTTGNYVVNWFEVAPGPNDSASGYDYILKESVNGGIFVDLPTPIINSGENSVSFSGKENGIYRYKIAWIADTSSAIFQRESETILVIVSSECIHCPGEVDVHGCVDFVDYCILMNNWGKCYSDF